MNCLTDGIDIPNKDSCIPIIITSRKILFCCLLVWLFLESFHLIDFIYGRWLCCSNIAVTGLRTAWLNTDCYYRFLIGGIAQCLALYSLILCGIDYQSIGWSHYYVCFRMFLLYLPASIGDTRCSIASLRFC